MASELPLDQILQGDCVEVLDALPEESIDLIFADPPYNLQLRGELWRPNMSLVDAVTDEWDQFEDFATYDQFSRRWIGACRRVLKTNGTIWVIGSYHNIYRLGAIMQDLGFWFLNDIIWVKTNPMPNFRGVRFANAHETLIWACKSKGSKYTFNHHAMKSMNEEKQMRSDWLLPICAHGERLRQDGKKAHSTQKPEALLYRVVLSSSNAGDVVLDPFFGSGTTGAVAKRLQRHWIGIERQKEYIRLAQQRIDGIDVSNQSPAIFDVGDKKRYRKRLPFGRLLEEGLITPGQVIYFRRDPDLPAVVRADGSLLLDGFSGSIHMAGRHLMGGSPCNGWDSWFFKDEEGLFRSIDELRQRLLKDSYDGPTDD